MCCLLLADHSKIMGVASEWLLRFESFFISTACSSFVNGRFLSVIFTLTSRILRQCRKYQIEITSKRASFKLSD